MPLVVVRKSASAKRENDAGREDESAHRKAFRALARALRSPASMAAVQAALRRRAPAAEIAELLVPARADLGADPRWRTYARASESAYARSMETGGERGIRDAGLERRVRFSLEKAKPRIEVPPNPYSLKWIREHGGERMVQVTNEQRALVRAVVGSAYKAGKRPEQIATSIRQGIGLTERMAQAVERRRELMLENGADESTADRGAESYSDKLLDQRADVIARTENKAAQEQGRIDSWMVAEDEGYMPEGAKKKWVSMPESPRLSDVCRELDGQVVDIRAPFVSEVLGEPLMGPPAHPNCRSTTVLVFDGE